MASGRTHRLVNVTAALLIPGSIALAWFAGDYSVGKWQNLATLGGGYVLSTIGIHPDQDIGGGKRIHSEQGHLWGSFLYYWTIPYGWIFDHRGISHVHLVGTLTRVLVMGLWLLPGVLILILDTDWGVALEYSGWAFLGMTVADSMHIAADGGRRQLEHGE